MIKTWEIKPIDLNKKHIFVLNWNIQCDKIKDGRINFGCLQFIKS